MAFSYHFIFATFIIIKSCSSSLKGVIVDDTPKVRRTGPTTIDFADTFAPLHHPLALAGGARDNGFVSSVSTYVMAIPPSARLHLRPHGRRAGYARSSRLYQLGSLREERLDPQHSRPKHEPRRDIFRAVEPLYRLAELFQQAVGCLYIAGLRCQKE